MAIIRHILIFNLALSFFLILGCQNDGKEKTPNNIRLSDSDSVSYMGPVIEFDTLSFNFGRVYEGETVGWNFRYTNTGDEKLILLNVTADCGCTIPAFKREPLDPGNSEEIKVVFDSRGRSGHQYKKIKVESNGQPGILELVITAEIIIK